MSHHRNPRGFAPIFRPSLLALCSAGAFAFAAATAVRAQTSTAAPSGASAPSTSAPADTVVLPSFSVTTSQDKGYLAANSVSATRINTPISDLPFSVSAFTQQFIQDTGANDLYDIVKYAAGGDASGAKGSSTPARIPSPSAGSSSRPSATASTREEGATSTSTRSTLSASRWSRGRPHSSMARRPLEGTSTTTRRRPSITTLSRWAAGSEATITSGRR